MDTVKTNPDIKKSLEMTSMIFSVKESVGVLAEVLDVFKKHEISLKHIESRVSQANKDHYEFIISCNSTDEELNPVISTLKQQLGVNVIVLSRSPTQVGSTPWFPRRIEELDQFANQILTYGSELDADHPVSSSTYFCLKIITELFTFRDSLILFIDKEESSLLILLLTISSKL